MLMIYNWVRLCQNTLTQPNQFNDLNKNLFLLVRYEFPSRHVVSSVVGLNSVARSSISSSDSTLL